MSGAIRRALAAFRRPAPELRAIEVHGSTRGAFIMRAALATGAASGVGAVGPLVGRALAAPEASSPSDTGKGDVEILNFALTLEYLEAEFYERALTAVNLSGDARRLTEELASNERDHVKYLTGAIRRLGGRPNRAPRVSFPFGSEQAYLRLAQTFEDTGVMAYNGAAPLLESKAVLNRAGQIVQVEGRHAGAIRMIRGQNVTDGALDGVLSFQEVVERVEPYVLDSPRSFEKAPPQSGI